MGALVSVVSDKMLSPEHDLSPLDQSSVYLVTGGLTGLAYHTTLNLARRGATVFVTARTLSRAQTSLNQLETSFPLLKGRVILVNAVVDLSTFAKARAGGEPVFDAIEARGGRLDAVCLNAARMSTDGPYEINEDGFELLVATNYFGTHIFLDTILPLLERRAKEPKSDVRIVYVGSNAQMFLPADWKLNGVASLNKTFAASEKKINKLQPGLTRYGVSKMLANPYIIELQARLDARNIPITAIVLHPGGVATPKVLDNFPVPTWLIHLLWITPEQGATTSLFALTNKEIARDPSKWKAKYLVPYGKIVKPQWKGGDNPALGRKLWEYTEEVVKRGGAENL